jgi:CMD domain protein
MSDPDISDPDISDRDTIDTLAGLAPGSPLALIRDRKPVTRQHAQASYRALFEPADTTNVTLQERFVIATFVAGLHAQDEIAAFYAAGLARTAPSDALVAALSAEITAGRTVGPYGAYPKGPLSVEDVPGPIYHATHRDALGARLTPALQHVHLLVFHPRDATPKALQALLDAGWSNTGIVTLSQLVAFLAVQIRAAAGLRTLAGSVP